MERAKIKIEHVCSSKEMVDQRDDLDRRSEKFHRHLLRNKHVYSIKTTKAMFLAKININELDDVLKHCYDITDSEIFMARPSIKLADETCAVCAFANQLALRFRGRIEMLKLIGPYHASILIASHGVVFEISADSYTDTSDGKINSNRKLEYFKAHGFRVEVVSEAAIQMELDSAVTRAINLIRSMRKRSGAEKKRLLRKIWMGTIVCLSQDELKILTDIIGRPIEKYFHMALSQYRGFSR